MLYDLPILINKYYTVINKYYSVQKSVVKAKSVFSFCTHSFPAKQNSNTVRRVMFSGVHFSWSCSAQCL